VVLDSHRPLTDPLAQYQMTFSATWTPEIPASSIKAKLVENAWLLNQRLPTKEKCKNVIIDFWCWSQTFAKNVHLTVF